MPDAANKKDVWDRLTALATILIPAAIALAGDFVARGLTQAILNFIEAAKTTGAKTEAKTTVLARRFGD